MHTTLKVLELVLGDHRSGFQPRFVEFNLNKRAKSLVRQAILFPFDVGRARLEFPSVARLRNKVGIVGELLVVGTWAAFE